MGTPCAVGRQNTDGTVTYILVNYDGYPTGAGATLVEHWTDPAKIDALMELGDLSSLGTEIGEKQNFDKPSNPDWCKAYGRDRGEEGVEAGTCETVSEFWNEVDTSYSYLFREGKWYSSEDETVTDLLKREEDED